MTTKEQANKCTTHHRACDCLEYKRECREYQFRQLKKALREIRVAASRESSDTIDVLIHDMDIIAAICDEVLGDE